MAKYRGENAGHVVHGRDIYSAFNSMDTKIMSDLIENRDLRGWVRRFPAPRSFQIDINRVIGELRMAEGTLQGSPLKRAMGHVLMEDLPRLCNNNATTRRTPGDRTTTSDSARRELQDHPIFVLLSLSTHLSPSFEASKSRDNQQLFPDNLYLGLPAQHTEPKAHWSKRDHQ